MNTDTQNTDEPSRTGPQMTRRQMIKTVGAAGGVAAVGSGAARLPEYSPVGRSSALSDECARWVTGASLLSGLGGWSSDVKDCLLGSEDVDEDLNTETYVYQIANTIADLRSGPTGDRTEIQREFVDAPQGQSAYAEAAGDTVISAAATKTFEGEGDQAESAARNELRKQTTRSLINIVEMWNAAVLRLVESGALIEDYEEGTEVLVVHAGSQTSYPDPIDPSQYDGLKGVEGSSPEGESGYICHKYEVQPSEIPMDPTNLDGREEPLTVYFPYFDIHSTDNAVFPFVDTNWFNQLQNTVNTTEVWDIETDTSNTDVTVVATELMQSALLQIENENNDIESELSNVVDSTVQGLEQGDLEPSDVLSGRDLLTDYDPNNDRGQLHREMMAIGMEMPGDPAFQAKISHPSLSADELWADLFIRLSTDSDLTIAGPMTVPAADYSHALVGYTGSASGEYRTQTLPGDSDLQILEIETPDQQVVETDRTVESGGTVAIAPADSEETPEPLAEPDPEYDDWGITVFAADGSNWGGTVADAYTEDEMWKVDTSLPEGLTVNRIHYSPPSSYNRTSLWTPGESTYDVETTQKTIEYRRKLNEKIEEEFNSVIGGGGLFDGGLPSLPGLGFIESVIVVILAIFGLNAASG